uniref:RNA-directed RNA polymerase n=2 Tax=unclassified Totiviridae TaxID=39756 RepID=A0A9E8YW01_9VIRU|nr:RNA-dependent RNA polymerase [Phytophthora palustris toti-like virus 1-1]WAK73599.1 RNA-dependent RNA polymerase [Phytophthora palustris toti-like virus 1-2]
MGICGAWLATQLDPYDLELEAAGLYRQMLYFHNLYIPRKNELKNMSGVTARSDWGQKAIKASAFSMLVADVPIQVPLNDAIVESFILAAMPKPPAVRELARREKAGIHDVFNTEKQEQKLEDSAAGTKKNRKTFQRRDILQLDKQHQFKIKQHAAAREKANVWATDVFSYLAKKFPHLYNRFCDFAEDTLSFTNDQMAACGLMALGLRAAVSKPVEMALSMVYYPKEAKAMATIIKSLGANYTRIGAMCCEGQALQGRGVGELDLVAEATARTGSEGKAACPDMFTDDELRAAVRYVIAHELEGRKVEFTDPEDMWTRRWVWCVNGGHSRVLERHNPKWKVEMKGHVHRRVAAEHWTANPLDKWDGNVYVSASAKLEHGKSRLLLACDTVSYVNFEHFLRPIENVWANDRVILDPGGSGAIGICESVKSLQGSVNVMLDYDDFNSQHTIRAMQIVFEEAGALTGYDEARTRKLVESFDRMYITAGGTEVGRATATLMSGHRATTFINSVLNAAYILAACPQLYLKFRSLHTGDDVVSKFSTYDDVVQLLDSTKARGLRMNPMKQSVGRVGAEFLRMAITSEEARGYLPRAVASLVSGNWVSTNKLGPVEVLRSAIGSCRSFINRSGVEEIAELMAGPVARRTGISKRRLVRILRGEVAVGPGPVFTTTGRIQQYDLHVRKEVRQQLRDEYAHAPRHATDDYLRYHATPVEVRAIEAASTDVAAIMCEASYAKSAQEAGIQRWDTAMSLLRKPPVVPRGAYNAVKLNGQVALRGALERFPLIQLVKSSLNKEVLVELLSYVGVNATLDTCELKAWGGELYPKVVLGTIPYSDAAALCKKVASGIIYVTYPIFM